MDGTFKNSKAVLAEVRKSRRKLLEVYSQLDSSVADAISQEVTVAFEDEIEAQSLGEALVAGKAAGASYDDLKRYVENYFGECIEASKKWIERLDLEKPKTQAALSTKVSAAKICVIQKQEECTERYREIVMLAHVLAQKPGEGGLVPTPCLGERVDTSTWLQKKHLEEVRAALDGAFAEVNQDVLSVQGKSYVRKRMFLRELRQQLEESSKDLRGTSSRVDRQKLQFQEQATKILTQSGSERDGLAVISKMTQSKSALHARLTATLFREKSLAEKSKLEKAKLETVFQQFSQLKDRFEDTGGILMTGGMDSEDLENMLQALDSKCISKSKGLQKRLQGKIVKIRAETSADFAAELAEIQKKTRDGLERINLKYKASCQSIVAEAKGKYGATCEQAIDKMRNSAAQHAATKSNMTTQMERIRGDLDGIAAARQQLAAKQDKHEQVRSSLSDSRSALRMAWLDGGLSGDRYKEFLMKVLQTAGTTPRMLKVARMYATDLRALRPVMRATRECVPPLRKTVDRLSKVRHFITEADLFTSNCSAATGVPLSTFDVNLEPTELQVALGKFRDALVQREQEEMDVVKKFALPLRQAAEQFRVLRSHLTGHRELLHDGMPVELLLNRVAALEHGPSVDDWFERTSTRLPKAASVLPLQRELAKLLHALQGYIADPQLIYFDISDILNVAAIDRDSPAEQQQIALVRMKTYLEKCWAVAHGELTKVQVQLKESLDLWHDWQSFSRATAPLRHMRQEVAPLYTKEQPLVTASFTLWPDWFQGAAATLSEMPVPPCPLKGKLAVEDPEVPVKLLERRFAVLQYPEGLAERRRNQISAARRRNTAHSAATASSRDWDAKHLLTDVQGTPDPDQKDPASARMSELEGEQEKREQKKFANITAESSPKTLLAYLRPDSWEAVQTNPDAPEYGPTYYCNRTRKTTAWSPPGTKHIDTFDFSGSQEVVLLSDTFHLASSRSFGFTCRMRTGADGSIFSFGPPGVSPRQLPWTKALVVSRDVLQFYVVGTAVRVVGETCLTDNTWHSVGLSVDMDQGTVCLHVDGRLEAQQNCSGALKGMGAVENDPSWQWRLGAAHGVLALDSTGNGMGHDSYHAPGIVTPPLIPAFFTGVLSAPLVLRRPLRPEDLAPGPQELMPAAYSSDGAARVHEFLPAGEPETPESKAAEAAAAEAAALHHRHHRPRGPRHFVESDIATHLGRDFSLACFVRTTHGGTVLSKCTDHGKWAPGQKALFVVTNPKALGTVAYCVGKCGLLHGERKVNDGQWHHIAVTYSGKDHLVRLYVDGLVDAEKSFEARADDSKWLTKIGCGARNFPRPESPFVGSICSLRYWYRVAPIKDLMAAMHALPEGQVAFVPPKPINVVHEEQKEEVAESKARPYRAPIFAEVPKPKPKSVSSSARNRYNAHVPQRAFGRRTDDHRNIVSLWSNTSKRHEIIPLKKIKSDRRKRDSIMAFSSKPKRNNHVVPRSTYERRPMPTSESTFDHKALIAAAKDAKSAWAPVK